MMSEPATKDFILGIGIGFISGAAFVIAAVWLIRL
jgi:hypothetical protein